MELTINNIEKQTEKAICVKITLEHPSSNKQFTKSQWLPKSVVTATNDNSVEVKDWFVEKMIAEQMSWMKISPVMASIVFKYVIDFGY